MRKALLVALALGSAGPVAAQGIARSVIGAVRDSAGAPLDAAEVLVAGRRVISNAAGAFRVDSLQPGPHVLTVRKIGYQPLRVRVEISSSAPVEVRLVMARASVELPPIVVEAPRTGIYGTVTESDVRPLPGAKIQVSGPDGGEMITDSAGYFNFPKADRGQYLLRATLAGHAERRFLVELKRGEGREVAVRMARSAELASRADEEAVEAMGERLSVNLSRERMGGVELTRYESLGLCDVNKIRADVGRGSDALTILILNGTWVVGVVPVSSLCSWRADEVALVEFGSDVCRDVTRTIPDLLGIWCETVPPSGRTRDVPRSIMSRGGRVRTQAGGRAVQDARSFVVIWEKR